MATFNKNQRMETSYRPGILITTFIKHSLDCLKKVLCLEFPVFSKKDPDKDEYERSVQNEVDTPDGCCGDGKDEIFKTPRFGKEIIMCQICVKSNKLFFKPP